MKKLKKLIPRSFITLATQATLPFFNLRYKTLTIRSNTTDASVFRDIFFYRDLELPSLTPPDIIIDAGAYVGYSTVYLAKQYPDAHIIAIEPEASNFAQLKKHTEHLPTVTLVHGALWPRSSRLSITDRGTGHWGFKVDEVPADTPHTVQGYTVSELLAEHDTTSNVFIKIDIEGSEKELFASDTATWLPCVNTLLIELHERINAGCKAVVEKALPTTEWDVSKKGEKLFFTRIV